MAILIRNGTIVNCDSMLNNADVLIEDGIIRSIGWGLRLPDGSGGREIDATGRYIMPGGIDPHTHLQSNFAAVMTADDYYHGSQAALAGGTTMFIDIACTKKKETLLHAYNSVRRRADPNVCCDYGITMAVTKWNESRRKEMVKLASPEYGINSYKFFLAYSGEYMVDYDDLCAAMKDCRKLGCLVRVHAEDGTKIASLQARLLAEGVTGPEGHRLSRPEEVEEEATRAVCALAAETRAPVYVVHVMSKGAARAIAQNKQPGRILIGEPTAAGLGADGSHYYHPSWHHAASFVMSPPLSCDPTTKDELMDHLARGTLDLVGSDNCTYTLKHRELGRYDFTKIPNGVNGLEDRMSVVWEKGVHSGKMDPKRFVAVTSATAAKIFNIYPRKGRIAVGSDADIVIWNGKATRVISASTHHHMCDSNVFEGLRCHGVCEVTIANGQVVWENNEIQTRHGSGRFIPMMTFSPALFPKGKAYSDEFSARRDLSNSRKSSHTAATVDDQSAVGSREDSSDSKPPSHVPPAPRGYSQSGRREDSGQVRPSRPSGPIREYSLLGDEGSSRTTTNRYRNAASPGYYYEKRYL